MAFQFLFINDFDFEVLQNGYHILDIFWSIKMGRQRFADVAVGEKGLGLCQIDEVMDTLSQLVLPFFRGEVLCFFRATSLLFLRFSSLKNGKFRGCFFQRLFFFLLSWRLWLNFSYFCSRCVGCCCRSFGFGGGLFILCRCFLFSSSFGFFSLGFSGSSSLSCGFVRICSARHVCFGKFRWLCLPAFLRGG